MTIPLLNKLTRIITTTKRDETIPHLALPQHDASQPHTTAPLLFFPASTLQNRRKTKQNRTVPLFTTTILTTTVLYSTLPYHYRTKHHSTTPDLTPPQQYYPVRHFTSPAPHSSSRDRYCSIQANNLRHLTETFTKRYLIRHNLHDSKTKPRLYNTSHNIFLYHRNTEQRRDHTITILSGHNRTSYRRVIQNLSMTIHYLLCHTSPWLDDTVPYTTSTSRHLTKRNQTITWLSLTRPPLQLTYLN